MVRQPVSFNVLLSEKEGFSGMARWMRKQSAEETGHACAIAEYMAKREAEAKVDKVDVVPQGWGSPTEVFEHALEHERHVSRLIDELVHLASEEKDNATRDFLWGFVRGAGGGRGEFPEHRKPDEESRRERHPFHGCKTGGTPVLIWNKND